MYNIHYFENKKSISEVKKHVFKNISDETEPSQITHVWTIGRCRM